MVSETLTKKLVSKILEDPAGFLIAQFDQNGAFEISIRSSLDLIGVPVIMRLKDDGDIHLTAIVADIADDSYSTTEYQSLAVSTKSGDTLTWRNESLTCNAYEDMRGAEEHVASVSLADMVYEWADVVTEIQDNYLDVEYAWFFPYGPYGMYGATGLFMHASNQPEGGR